MNDMKSLNKIVDCRIDEVGSHSDFIMQMVIIIHEERRHISEEVLCIIVHKFGKGKKLMPIILMIAAIYS